MMKHYKNRWAFVLLSGIISLMSSGILADKDHRSVQCKNSLQQFSLRLEERSKQRTNQAYYESLYQQTQNFLNTLEGFPASPSQLDKCENFLKVIQDIIGNPGAGTADLAPLSDYASQQAGKLTNPGLETTLKRPLRQSIRSIRYVDDDQVSNYAKDADEETEEADAFPSSPTPRSSRTGKVHIPKERELE